MTVFTKWQDIGPFYRFRIANYAGYDQTRDRIVTYGNAGEIPNPGIMEFNPDTCNWVHPVPVHQPLGQSGANQLAYHPSNSGVGPGMVFFGGLNPASPHTVYDETWIWDGIDWTQMSPAAHPPGLWSFGLAYDAVREEVVLFGGYEDEDATITNGETWTWDGTNWTHESPTHSPGADANIFLAWDSINSRIVLLTAGAYGATAPYGETWTWDGTDWTQHVVSPPTNPGTASGFFPMTGVVGQGVYGFNGNALAAPWSSDSKTWHWNGSAWSDVTPASPSDNPTRPPSSELLFIYNLTEGPSDQAYLLVPWYDPGDPQRMEVWSWSDPCSPPDVPRGIYLNPAVVG